MSGNTNKRISSNKKLKEIALVIAIILGIIVIQFGVSKYMFNKEKATQLNFYEYRIQQSEIFISPETYTGEEVTVTITAEKPGLSVQYQLGNDGKWIDYTGPFSVDENTKINTRYVAAKDNFEGPITDKDVKNIAVAKIGDTYYKTLEAAIAACPENAEDTQTKIEMLTDVTESVVIPAGKNVLLDLCGVTVTGKNEISDATITVNGKFNIIDSTGDGKIVSSANCSAVKVTSTGDFTIGTNESEPIVSITNPIITGDKYGVIIETNGRFNFFDGKVMGKTNAINGSVTNKPNAYDISITLKGDSEIQSEKEYEIAVLTKTYVITYNGNCDNAEVEYLTETKKSGEKIGKLPTAQREGYLLKGWYTQPTDGTKITVDTVISENTTYYAQWEAYTYTIIYNSNDKTKTTKNVACKYDADVIIEENSFTAPKGYTFKNWNTKEDGTGIIYNPATIVKNLTNKQSGIINLYAIWEDTIEPNTEASTAIATTSTITVQFNQTDDGTGINESTIEYAIKINGTWSDWQTGNTFENLIANTKYTIKTRVIDNAGNGPTESVETEITTKNIEIGSIELRKNDINGETIIPTTNKDDKSNQINNDINIKVTPAKTGTTTVVVKNQKGVTETITKENSTETADGGFQKTIITETGLYEITTITSDGTNETTETVYVYVDKTAPTVNSTNTKTTNTITVQANAVDDDSGLQTVTYEIKKGDTVIATNTTGKFTKLEDDTEYTITIIATDKAGNTTTDIQKIKTNKLVPGSLTFIEDPSNTSFIPSENIWINENVKTMLIPGNAGTTTYEVTSPDGTTKKYTTTQTIETVTGTYTVVLTTTDGTNTETVNYTFNVDKIAPTVTYGTNGGTYTIPVGSTKYTISSKITVTDNGGSKIADITYAWSTSNTTQPETWVTTTNGATIENEVTGGKYYLWVKTTDNAGNETITKTSPFDIGYAIEYDKNGGTGTITNQRKTHGTNITLNNGTGLSKTGYTFIGWSENQTATQAQYGKNASYTANKSVKLYAVWQANTYNISYVLNGGTNNSSNPSTYTYGKGATLSNATKQGYTFDGWYTESTFENKITSISTTQTGNITVYAKYNEITYTLTYDLAGGSLATGKVNPSNYTIGMTDFTLNNPTKTGYSFKGWTGGVVNAKGELDNTAKTGTTENTTTPQTILVIKQGSLGNRKYTANWVDDIPPSTDAPSAVASTSTITVTSNQKDEGTGITSVKYAISEDGITWSEWQESDVFTALQPNKEYYVKTQATDNAGNNSESESKKVKTESLEAGSLAFYKNNINGASITPATTTEEEKPWVNSDIYVAMTRGTNGTTTYEVTSPDGTKQTYTNNATIPTVTGEYKITVITTDGNNTITKTYYIDVDKELPTAVYGTNGGTYTILVGLNTTNVSTKVTAQDNGGSGLSSVEYIWSKDSGTTPTEWTQTTSGATLTQSLEGGKNYLWIKTTDNAGNENIQISNEFNVGYEVKYNSNKGTGTIKSQRKEDGVTLKLNDGKGFARDGYTLLGWARSADATSVQYNLGGNFLLNEPSTLYAVWEANSNTVYKVEFYNQSNGTYSQTPTKTENRTGTTDTTVSITEQDKTAPAGYAYDTAAANIETGTVAGNGSLVLKVYYKQQFTVKYKPGTQGTFEETVFENLDYGTTTPEYTKSKTGKPGYTFAKWSPEIATTVTENIEYIATWSANTDTKYKVEHYKQTLTGTYELEETENLTGTTDETATAIAKTYDGFTENETNTSRIPTGTIAGDGSLTLKLYYDRNSYELTINHYVQNADDNKFTLNKTQTESGKVFGSTIEINTKKIDIENATYSYGTDSTGTTKTTITIASSNNVINLYYVRNTATLTVNHYVENANNAEYTLQSTKEIENIKIGSTITLANYVDTGIENVSLNTEKTQTTTTMSANGTTINLYYSRNTYVLTLSKNENIQSATGDGTYKWGQSVTINATVATQTGYTYTWNKWESNNTSLLANQTSRQVTITMPVGNVTLKATATKTANKYSIEYNSNGGSGTTASTQCTYDVEATIAQNAFVGPEGYKGFVKWNTNADGTGTTYNPGDKVKNLNSTQGGKVILYAIWEDIDAPQNEAPSAVANTNTITVTCNQTDSGTGIDETTIQYAIYKAGAWSEWQDSNIFTGLKANTQYKVKTKVSDKAGNGPTESEETTKSTTSIELGTLVFHKDSQTGNIINAPTAEPENPTYINNNIYIDMTAGPVGTTTYTAKDPDGVTTTYSEDKLITTKTGKYEITITTTDNVNSPSETYYIYVDKTNPTLKPTYTKTTNSIKVTANAQDADSGIDKITYVIKNGSTVIATNTTGKFTGLQNNFEYTVVTTVTDKAGNSASKTEIVKTNQLTVGTITFKESTTNTTFTPSADVWVNDDVKTTLVPGSAGTTTYEVTSPDGTKQTYTSSATLTTVNGTYTVTVKTTDGTNTKTRTYTFNVDKTEPTITFGTNGGTYTIPVGSTTIQISSKITGEDEGGSGISSVQYAWSTSNTTAPTQWTTIENGGSATLSAQGGKQYLWAKTEDKAGNEKVSTTAAFEIGYAIEYDVKGGTGTIANQRKVHGTNITLNSGSSLSKKGYTFKGWDTSETATKVVYAGGASYTTNQSVKLYAVWQINTYKITYNLNGGSLEQGKTNPTTYNINTATITLKNPTNISKPGYNFTGWTGSNGTTPRKSVTIAKGSTGNKTYTANWEEKTTTYTVEHYKENLDGTYTKATSDTQQLTAGINTEVTATYKTYTGFSSNTSYESKVESGNVGEDGSLVLKLYYSRKTITVTYNYQYNGGSTATKTTATLKYGASVDLTPTATKDNYTFVGWNTNKNAKQKLSTLTAGTSNITLYAIYSKKITVTYNKNGGSANLTQTYTMYNNETTLSITYPTTPTTYTGWTFECFGDTATSTTGYAKGATRNVTIASATKTLTYYHNWSKNITLTFIDYKNTTKTTRTANTTVYNGNKATLNVPAQNTYTGWTKRGWTTSTSNTAEPTLNAAGGSISNVTANATYYGLYSKNVTVTFNTNGSIITNISNETGTRYTNSYAISTIKNPSITIPSNTIKKPGYTWNEKWNDKIDGSGTSYTKGTSYTFTADKTLYPEYAIDSYAITYNLNGGSLATGVTNPTSYNVKSSNITLNNPTKTGYVFNGWEETIKNIKWTDGFTDMTTGYIQDSTTYPNSVYSEPILLKAGNTYTDSIGTDIRWRIYNLDGTYVGNKSSQATYTPESDCYAIIVHYTGLTEEQQQNLKITVQDPILDVTIPTGSTGNREYKATWDTDTVKYTVYHYLENANDTGYTLHKTERKDGQTNETITLANEKITIANSTYKQGSLTAGGTAATTTTVAANSSTKIYLYYTRNKYKLTLNKNGNIASTTGAGTYKWGQTVNISATLGSTSGYTYKWTNWTSSNTNLLPNQTEQAATITMPAGAITLTANATKTANKYTVTYNYVQNGGDSSTASTKTVTYGTAVDLTPTATKANYVFIGWNTSSTATTGLTSYKMPAKNVTLYAIFKKAVAKIETGTATTYYLTLQDAIDAAGTTKTTVTMIDDVSLPTTVGTVASGENIVLDLNGHTIQTTGEDIYVIRNTGNIEIQDTLGGGKLTSTTSGIIYNSESGKCVLTTGTIEAGEKNAISNNTNATFEMNGGTITSEAQGINSINTAKVIVKGGKIETVQNAIYNAAGTVEIKGGTLTSGSYAVVRNNEDTGIINISAGTLKGESYGVYNAKAGTINVSGGTIQCRDGVYNNGKGTINITNGTITGTGAQGVRGGTGTVNISGTPKITGTTFGVSVTTGTLKITGGTIVATEGIGAYAYTTEKTATLTIGTNETTPSVSTTVPSITGKTYGVQVGGTFNFYDGIIKGQSGAGTSIIGTVTSTPTGYGVKKTVETVDSVTTETAILITKNYAEYNGSTIVSYYETLASATTYATSGNTIKPLTNRTETIESTITVSKNVTLDLNGKTITLNGVTLKNNGILTIQGTGTLTGSGENTVTNLGTLTKTGTSIIANTSTETYYAISNIEKATATITGGTITSTYRTINNDNKLTITGGTITGSDIAVNNSGTAIITDGKITSTQQVGIYNSETGILTLGTNETTPSVNIAVPSIKGKTYGIQTGGTFNFYDGIIKGQSGAGTSIIGTVTSTPTGYGVRKAVETVDSVTTETAILVTKNYAEYNGSTIVSYYETLASATTYATSGNTIKPLVNRTETIEATVTASKNITLDLNGKTITLKNQTLKNNGTLTITGSGTLTGSGANTVTNAGTLTKTGTSTIINTSTSTYGAIGNTETATISAGTITSAYRTITNSNKLTITGGTITGSDIAVNNSGTATVTGGTITSTDKIGIYNTTDGTLTIGTNETTPSVSTTVPSVTGKTYGVQAGKTFNFYDGVIKGQSGAGTSINGTLTATPTGYFAKKTLENDVETAILEQAHTLTINPNGGTWNGKSAVSTVVDAAKAIISLGKATAPNPYVVTYNPNYTGSSTTYVNATRVFDGWTLSGAGGLVNSSAIEEGSFTKTVKTESAGEYFRFTKTVSTALTTSTYYGICLPNYEYTSGNSYTIKFKLRINQLPEGASLKFRHAAINNDYATEGLVKKDYDSTTNGWVDVYMTRTFTGTTITQGSTTYDITPRFEMYTSDIKDKTGTFNFDIKDVMIINNTTCSLIQSTDYAYMYGTNDGTVTAKYTTNAITLKALTRNGYTLDGWYKEAACTNKVGSAGSLYTPTGNITLYAKWKVNNYEETSNNSHVEYYETLAEAISSANSGNHIVVLNNRTETESATIPSGKTLTFNLGAKTVTLNGATLTNNGTLTIEGNGTLTGSGANTVTNNGTFRKIDNSTIKNTSTSKYCAIKNTGTATIEKGTISGEYRAIETSGTQTLTVKGAYTSITAKNCAIYSQGTANTTSVPAVRIESAKLIESTDSVSVYNNGSGLVYITGGTIKQQGSNSVIGNNSTGTIQIAYGIIQGTGTAGYAINNVSTGTVKVENGTISNTVAGTINNGSTGRIEVSGGTITSATTALYNTGAGTINVTGGTITGQNTQAIRGGTGTVSISGSPKITGKAYGVSVTTGTLTITGGTIEATEGIGAYAYNADEVATLTIGTNEATPSVNTSVPSITGKTYGVQVGGTFNFYDGILKGKSGPGTAINGTITATPTGYDVYKTVDNDDIESAILTKNFTLTINPNGGTWNGTTSTSKIVDNSRDIISIGEPTPPTPYVVTYNHNYTGSTNKTANATRIFDIWKLTSGDGTVVGASDIEATSFTKTNKTETAGDYINFKKVVSTAPTESVNYRFNMPNYTYRSGYSYTIKFKLRINQLPEGGVLNFRHAAINNDYATDGLVKKVYNTTTDGWIDVYMTRKFTGTTITQKSTTYDITPRFEMYTSDFKDKTGTFDFDIKDVMIIDNSSYYIVQSTNTAYMYRLRNGTITAQYITNSINLETPTRTGYTFDGWYKEAACTNKVGDAGAEYTPISNITLYAKWKQNNYEEVTSSGAHVNYYVSLASAMANVTSGNTIKPLNNITETVSSTVTASKTVTFNLNGKTVTLNSSSLTNNGKLTITGTGTLTGTSGYTIRNIGTLTKTGASSIKNEGTSQTTVIVNEGTATISAGTINGSYKGIETKGTGTLTISGATVTTKNYAVYSQGTANTTTAPAVKIVSGTIESTAAVSVYNNAAGLIYATGGTIKQQGSNSVIANNSTGTIQLSGATVEKSSGTGGYAAIYNISTGTIKVTSGNINNSVSRAIYNKGAGTINVTGGTISGIVGIHDVEGSISVTSGTINATNGAGVRVGTGTATISGSSTKITGTTYGVDATTGTTTIKAGTIEATDGIGVQVAGGTLTIGTNETTPSVSTTVPSITGSTKGVNVSSGTFNFYDGVIKGQSGAGTSIVGTVTATPTNYNVYKTVDNDNVESAILMQEHTLTVNQNGGVWNGSSAISRVKDVTKAVISIEEPIAPSPYVITYNHNIEGRPDTKLNAIRVFDGWTLTGQGNLVEGSEIETTTFTKTSKTETAGDYWNFKKVVSTVPTTSTNYRINLPNYEYTSGNSYTIKFKLRINQLPSGVSLVFRNAAINNDYATEGLVKKNYDATTNGWVDVYMTRTFTGTTIVQGSTTYDITPRFEMYTGDIKGKTGTFDFDIKDVRVINNTTGKLVQSTDIAYMYGDGDGTIKSNYKVEPTNLITPVRDGYICEGWYKEAACTNKVGNAGSPYTATGNVTLYAKWKETNYEEVTLDGTHVNYYITLASAMANVTSGNTIKVLVDRTETIASTVTKSKTVILDLNGKTVTLNGVTLKVNGALKITGEGTLTGSGANTITNAGSLTKTGTSTIANTSTSSYYTIKNTGNATLEAGTLTSAYRTIDNSETGEVVVSGATVNSTGEGHTIYNTSTSNTTDAPAVKVTSGTVSAVAGISGNSAIRSIGTGLIYLTGGTIESESIYTLYLTNSSLQVDGATIKNINTESTSTGTAISSNGSIKVISGTITSDIGEAMNGSEQITISGGTIQGGTTGITITNANAKLKISGGTIKGTTQAGVLVGDSTVEITGGTITGGGSSTEGVAGILHTGTGSILMYNGKVTCEPGVNYGVKQTGSGTIEVFGGSISSGNGGTGIKQTAGYIRLLEASARYSGAVVSGYYNAIDLTGSTETVELEIGNRSATFDDNSDYKLRRPYISGTGSTILGDNSTNIEITFGNGTIKTTGGSTGQTGGGTTAAYAFFDIPDSQITVRNGYVKQTTGGLYETNYTYLVPEGSANSTNSDNTNTANISNETNTLLKARVTSKLMSVLNNTNKEQNSSNNEDNVSDNTTNQNTIENTKDNNTSEKTKDNNTSEDTKDNTENNENTGKNTEENTVKNTEQNTNETTETDTTNSNENVVEIPKVVQTGGKNYATLAEAINSAENDGMIEILDDISLTEKVTIDESKNIKLSLNSKTISCTSSSTLVNNGTLTIISSGIIRNETDNGVVITNNGTLNIQEGIITTAKNGGKGIYNTKTLNVSGGKIVTEGIGAVGIYNVTKSQLTVTGGIIEITGFGSKAIYNNSEVVFEENSNKNIIPKVVVSGDDGIGIYNSKDSTKCDIKSGEFIVEAEVIENYDLIKNTNEFKSELEKMKPSYGIYNDSEIDVNIEKATIKVERLKGVGILNNSIGSIVLGKNDETLNLATPIIYAISDNTTAIINTKAPYANSADSIATNEKYGNIKFYDGTISTLVSIKDVVTVILDKHEIVENKGYSVINTILKIIEKQ